MFLKPAVSVAGKVEITKHHTESVGLTRKLFRNPVNGIRSGLRFVAIQVTHPEIQVPLLSTKAQNPDPPLDDNCPRMVFELIEKTFLVK